MSLLKLWSIVEGWLYGDIFRQREREASDSWQSFPGLAIYRVLEVSTCFLKRTRERAESIVLTGWLERHCGRVNCDPQQRTALPQPRALLEGWLRLEAQAKRWVEERKRSGFPFTRATSWTGEGSGLNRWEERNSLRKSEHKFSLIIYSKEPKLIGKRLRNFLFGNFVAPFPKSRSTSTYDEI